MASRIRSVDFLPEIFQTDTNKQFLGSTLDQLIQEPKLKRTQGYIGRKIGVGVTSDDVYIPESTENRNNYQLEPAVTFLQPNTNNVNDVLTYPGIVDSLAVNDSLVNRHDRLWSSQYYSFDPLVDYDKWINYGQYYWLPEGPDSVSVSATETALIKTFDITRTTSGYRIAGYNGNLPTITLLRKGNYQFSVNQLGHPFWIQAATGDGTFSFSNQSTRDVLGVTNNGDDVGLIQFNVPDKRAQDFYNDMASAGNVDFATNLKYNQINNVTVEDFFNEYPTGIDGITDIENRTIIFLTQIGGEDGGWVRPDSSIITNPDTKYSVWRISYTAGSDPTIQLTQERAFTLETKAIINYGKTYGGAYFYRTNQQWFAQVPLITANLDVLYYVDGTDPSKFGTIQLLDSEDSPDLNVNDILTRSTYTSPNGVTFTNGLKVRFDGPTIPSSYSGNEYYVEGVGKLIELIAVDNLITPEPFTKSSSTPYDSTPYDEGNFDDTLNAPLVRDYITINRASPDENAWSRSNRWFHIDVINATADYNNNAVVLDNDSRAKRPILEFLSGLKLFNFGTSSVGKVDVIDFNATDAFSDINGTIGYSVDGYPFVDGTKVIFADDRDDKVRNKIYTVEFVKFDDSSEPVINLTPADITTAGVPSNSTVVVTKGLTGQGKSYYYNGTSWVDAQDKTATNQAPLFDVFDSNGNSFSDSTYYVGTSFTGSKLFGYGIGSGVADSELGFPIKYLSVNNIGDIVFENYFYIDSFNYVSNNVSTTLDIKNGFARTYSDRTTFQKQTGWQKSYTDRESRQILSFEYTGNNLLLDVLVDSSVDVPVKVYVDGEFYLPENYTYSTDTTRNVTVITFTTAPTVGSLVEVSVVSKSVSDAGYYSVPLNLENNALNSEVTSVTLGTARNHYTTICSNLSNFDGSIHGANNIRDLGDVVPYGDQIIQHSSPLTMCANFINDPEYQFFNSLEYSRRSYENFKALLINTYSTKAWSGTTAKILDDILQFINVGKNINSPFYYSDMIPSGETYDETSYTITAISGTVFSTLRSYDFTKANYQGILVYLNDVLLIGDGHDYTVATDGPRITVATTLSVGDKLVIREYESTLGNYIPNTPSKLGLAPVWEPEKVTDNSYITPQDVIIGHDGSQTIAYGDDRDDLLIEFERRVYNNVKVLNRYNPPLPITDVMPGQFRDTDYSLAEINNILSESFLSWVGQNRVAFRDQDYIASNEFTYNYSRSQNKLDNTLLLGAWRGIYNYLYDTDVPHLRPWEMLGFTEKPDYWDLRYGSSPYTSGNLVLWEDLSEGYVADPANPRTLSQYARPDLLSIIPVDSLGNLIAPLQSVVGTFDSGSFQKSWVFGDGGPTETAWRRSSSYQFALQKLLALTQPAKYFALNADIDLYRYDTGLDQWLYNERFRLQPENLVVYGTGTSKNSYLNWIVDYNKISGLDSANEIMTRLDNLDVRLAYRMGAYSDKKYLKIFTEKSTPDSLNTSLLIPDESFQLKLYKNPTLNQIAYSSVIVQRTDSGYIVSGYSINNPYFTIYNSVINGSYDTLVVGNTTIRVNKDHSDNITRIPYGYEFTTLNGLADFLVSYGVYLERSNMVFDNIENGVVLDWLQMAQEAVLWSNQGWGSGSLINLNPGANQITINTPNQIVEDVSGTRSEPIFSQDRKAIGKDKLLVSRIENTFKLSTTNNDVINYLGAKTTAYEHIIVFDNTSLFNDLIYNPSTGARQLRLLVNGSVTYEWNGTLDAQGFILNQDNIQEWKPNRQYSKGEIVLYKDEYWSAGKLLSPTGSFDFNDWIKSDYDLISKGLLPNAATKAGLISNYYDTNIANLETDADLLGAGLIGFRPREYMQSLNLDDVSQVQLYKQFLKTKGTVGAAEIFTQARLDKEVADYNIIENWALLKASYGATASRAFIEIQTDESLLTDNPTTIQLINTQQTSTANQSLTLDALYKQSYKITDVNVFPALTTDKPDTDLPNAGYVNWDDVDIKVFSIDDLTDIINQVETVRVGTTIWIAKVNSYNWDVYRTNDLGTVLEQVQDNLNGTCTLTFRNNHNLGLSSIFMIKGFDDEVDGAYKPTSITGLKAVTINLSLSGDETSLTGVGNAFVLSSVRVAQPSDIASLPTVNTLTPLTRAWVNNAGDGTWGAYEKRDSAFTINGNIEADAIENAEFGTAVSQGLLRQGALISSPGYEENLLYVGDGLADTFSFLGLPVSDTTTLIVRLNSVTQTLNTNYTISIDDAAGTRDVVFTVAPGAGSVVELAVAGGAVYTFNTNSNNEYVNTTVQVLGARNTVSLGSSLASSGQQFSVAGSPQSGGKQGYSLLIKRDSANGAYSSSQILTPEPRNLFKTLGSQDSTQLYDFSSAFTTTDETAIAVLVDDEVKTAGTDWQLVGSDTIEFFTRVDPGASIYIYLWEQFGSSVAISQDDRWMYIGGPGNNVVRAYNRVDVQNQVVEAVGNGTTTDYDISDTIIVDDDSAAGGIGADQILVTRNNILQVLGVDWTYDAPEVQFVTAPNLGDEIRISRKTNKSWTVGSTPQIDFLIEDLYTVTDIYSFSVRVNGVLQRPNYDYIYIDDSTAKEIQFLRNGVSNSTVTVNSDTYWKLIDTITIPAYAVDWTAFTDAVLTAAAGGSVPAFFTDINPDTGYAYSDVTYDGDISAIDALHFAQYGAGTLTDPTLISRIANIIEPAFQVYREAQPTVYNAYFTEANTSNTLNAEFGYAVDTTTDGRQVAIGDPGYRNNTGRVYVYDRSVERFQVENTTTRTYTVASGVNGNLTVKLNDTFLTPSPFNNNGQYTVNGSTVTILSSVTLNLGDIIEIENNNFKLMSTLDSNDSATGARFGASLSQCPTNCSLYIGSPKHSGTLVEAGQVERFANQNRLYGTITSTNPSTLYSGNSIRINNYQVYVPDLPLHSSSTAYLNDVYVNNGSNIIYHSIQAVPTGTSLTDTDYWELSNWPEAYTKAINDADIPNVTASVANELITLSIVTAEPADRFIKLQVLPGIGSAYNSLGFEPLSYVQTITSPYPVRYSEFGSALQIDQTTSTTLVVGSPKGNAAKPMTLDGGDTVLDGSSTTFTDIVNTSGVVYTYDFLESANSTVTNPGKFVFGSQIYDDSLVSFDQFGSSVSLLNNRLLIGSPGSDLGDSSGNFGRVAEFSSPTTSTWYKKYSEIQAVDVSQINSVFTYDRVTSETQLYLDTIDPLQGKILGSARQNIDYITSFDPASYNNGGYNNVGTTWNDSHVGEIWWNVSNVRFIDYRQDTIEYRAKRWGQVFPGSSIDVYQWTESTVPPAQYAGPGTVYSTTSYVVGSELTSTGNFITKYYYWVTGLNSVVKSADKTLSTNAIKQYIENPLSSGIPYLTALSQNTIALNNCDNLFSAKDTILHVDFDRVKNDDNVHVEYDLIQSETADSFLDATLFTKFVDSLCGANSVGNIVPDPRLSPAERYGTGFRPRQSVVVDRFEALQNYIVRANSYLALFPITEIRSYPLLLSQEATPSSASGEWNKSLNNYSELLYQDPEVDGVGYKYLVLTDENNEGLWTIYTVQSDYSLLLTRVQNYDTTQFWSYVNWVATGYDTSVRPVAEVEKYSDIELLTGIDPGDSVKVLSNSADKFEIYQLVDGSYVRKVLEDGTVAIDVSVYNYGSSGFGFDLQAFDSQRFDQNPITETRQILKSLNEEIFINDLAIYRNNLLILMFEYIMSEQIAPEWLTKTSLINVSHKIRDLLPYNVYRADNQDFVIDYIREVKPYHVKIKEFALRYDGVDYFKGDITDFDLPAYYDDQLNKFVSPQLTFANTDLEIWQTWPYSQWFNNYKYTVGSVDIVNAGEGYTVAPVLTVTGTATRQAVLEAVVNSAGQIVRVDIIDAGEGYTTSPVVTVTGGNGTGGIVVARLKNETVRHIKPTIKFDRYEYTTAIQIWTKNTYYEEGSLVRYNNKVYSVNQVADSTSLFSGSEFDVDDYTEVDASTLSGIDRTMGYYTPDIQDPGKELALLITGIDYPGVQVDGPGFDQNSGYDVAAFDTVPYDNIDYGPEGLPTYSEEIIDTIYQSSFTDTYLGTRSTDINVEGGEFIDTYSSHAPQELVPGSMFDSLNLTVRTTPGADWEANGHGFEIKRTSIFWFENNKTIFFSALMPNPVALQVINQTQGYVLDPSQYSINWFGKSVTVNNGALTGDALSVVVFGIGGGNQLLKESYQGSAIIDDELFLDLDYSLVDQLVLIVNSEQFTAFTIADNIQVDLDAPAPENYLVKVEYTSLAGTVLSQTFTSDGSTTVYGIANNGENIEVSDRGTLRVFTGETADTLVELTPDQFTIDRLLNFSNTLLLFNTPFASTDFITVIAFGEETPTTYNYSYPISEYFVFDGSTKTFTLENELIGTNDVNMIVEVDGLRLRPFEGIEYTSDGSSLGPYYLPNTGGTNQGTISDNEVIVYVDGVKKFVFADFIISTWDGSSDRYIEFNEQPANGANILISVTTSAEYSLNGQDLTIKVDPSTNANIRVVTFNDTRQQELLTQVWQGPTQAGEQVNDPFDPLDRDDTLNGDPGSFDFATVNGTQWSFDFGTGTISESNRFDTGRTITNGERLFVSLNGAPLIFGDDFIVNGTEVEIGGGLISASDIVVITSMTQDPSPNSLNFTIFQDMLGNQKIYRALPTTTTTLAQSLSTTDDTIYLFDASGISNPSLDNGVFGVIMVGAERILFRNIDTTANTVSGLRRGVAGTPVIAHQQGEFVQDASLDNQLQPRYQKTTYKDEFTGNGTNTRFVCTNVTLNEGLDSTQIEEVIRVRVGGVDLQDSEYVVSQIDPVEVNLDTAPGDGVDVLVYTVKATVMYAQGTGTPSDGVPLQEQETLAAQFLRGDN